MTTVELEIPPRSAYVKVVRLAIASLARSKGLDEETIDDLKIAVGEAVANAVIANEEIGSVAPVSIAWSEEPDGLVIEVKDRGAGLGDEDPYDSGGFQSRLTMSVALLQSLVGRCELLERDGGGTCTRLLVPRGRRASPHR